jgi:hypothetical protein
MGLADWISLDGSKFLSGKSSEVRNYEVAAIGPGFLTKSAMASEMTGRLK